jgi:hypothetical protein
MVEHFIDSVGHRRFHRNRRDLPVTKFQNAHKYPSRPGTDSGLMNYARGEAEVKKIGTNLKK